MKRGCGIALLFLILPLCFSREAVATSLSYTATLNITVKLVYYLHRTDLTAVTPAGKLMNATRPLSDQPETIYTIARGGSVYFYTPPLSARSIRGGTWILFLWASTVSSGKISKLTVRIHVVSSDGTIEKALIGSITDITIDYGYSERTIQILGTNATIESTDRIRLTLYAQTGATNDAKGMSFYFDGYGTYETLFHETRLQLP
jgi:hypothetical protein